MASTDMAAMQAKAADVSAMRIALWTALFQIAWFWRKIPELFSQGALSDTDDFQRLAQVRAWMGGQGWYDLFNHRMAPPAGADMHWSRLVDVPIAALIGFFDLFVDSRSAEMAAGIVWPMALLIATVFVILAICRRLDPTAPPLLALLFTVTCVTALTEFMPGRFDHHNVQILLYCLMLLGLVSHREWWGRLLLGATAATSVSIGLDAILLVAFLLFWTGMEWVLGRDRDGKGLRMAALGIVAAALPLYVLNFPPSQWLVARCDANSAFYLAALLFGSAAFAALSLLSKRFDPAARSGVAARLASGAVAGGAIIGVLAFVSPQCLAGPFAGLPPELMTRWLVHVLEARGFLDLAGEMPELWLQAGGYLATMLAVSALVLVVRGRGRPEFLALFAVLAISGAAAFLQYRAMRVGVFAAIPFCVVFTSMVAGWLSRNLASRPLSAALEAGVVVMLLSPAWLAAGFVVFPAKGTARVPVSPANAAEASWRATSPALFCNRAGDYEALLPLPRGLVMSDIDSGAAVPVFTAHTSIGGPYHRNATAILTMLDFFHTDVSQAREIAVTRGIDYVAWCEPIEKPEPGEKSRDALALHILAGTEPDWLERVSEPGDRLHVFRVKTLQN